jgi:hypothetical protein
MKVFARGAYKITTAFDQYQSINNSWSDSLRRQPECEPCAEIEADRQYRNSNWLKKSGHIILEN